MCSLSPCFTPYELSYDNYPRFTYVLVGAEEIRKLFDLKGL